MQVGGLDTNQQFTHTGTTLAFHSSPVLCVHWLESEIRQVIIMEEEYYKNTKREGGGGQIKTEYK